MASNRVIEPPAMRMFATVTNIVQTAVKVILKFYCQLPLYAHLLEFGQDASSVTRNKTNK